MFAEPVDNFGQQKLCNNLSERSLQKGSYSQSGPELRLVCM